jgi:hypothetical protein
LLLLLLSSLRSKLEFHLLSRVGIGDKIDDSVDIILHKEDNVPDKEVEEAESSTPSGKAEEKDKDGVNLSKVIILLLSSSNNKNNNSSYYYYSDFDFDSDFFD